MTGSVWPIAQMFRAPKAGTLETVELNLKTISAAQDVQVQFRDASESTGEPSVTVDAFRTIPSGSLSTGWTLPGILSSDGTDGGTKKTVTQGQLMAVVLTWPGTTGSLSWGRNVIFGTCTRSMNFPSGRRGSSGGLFTFKLVGHHLTMGLKYDDGTYGYVPFLYPRTDGGSYVAQTTTAVDEFGLRFQFPFRFKAIGAWTRMQVNGALDLNLLLDDDTEVVSAVSYDRYAGKSDSFGNIRHFMFDAEVTFEANTWYRMVFLHTGGTEVEVLGMNVADAAHFEAWPPPRQKMQWTERVSAGAWTNIDTRAWLGGFIMSAIDDGT